MTSLTPARDAVIASREKMRAALADELTAGGIRAMHAELTLGLNDLIGLHIADCLDQNVATQDCFETIENAMANAIGTVVMSGSEDADDRVRVWGGFMMMITQKSQRALELVEAGVPGTSISTRIDTAPAGNG